MDTYANNSMTIGDLVDRYGVAAQSLRNWEQQGLIPPARRTPGGHRRYGSEHVTALDQMFNMTSRPDVVVTIVDRST
jgi:DNA-binding transcriptional MerR regulator